ncbi:MAG: YciI family protein [Brevirhabdus sp.]
MPNFVFAYHGGKAPESPEEGEKVMAEWMAWFGTMGDAVVDGGNPVGMSRTVSNGGVADDGGANPLSGYSIIAAADHDAACEIAKGCPMVVSGEGSVEVAEIMEM